MLIVVINGAAFVLAVGVPIFNSLLGITSSLFAAWFTYGIAGKCSAVDVPEIGLTASDRHVLAARLLPRWSWVPDLVAQVVSDDDRCVDGLDWRLHLRCGNVRDGEGNHRGISDRNGD